MIISSLGIFLQNLGSSQIYSTCKFFHSNSFLVLIFIDLQIHVFQLVIAEM